MSSALFLLYASLPLSIAQALLWLKIGTKPSHNAQSTLACSLHFLGSLSSSANSNPLSTGGLICHRGLGPTVKWKVGFQLWIGQRRGPQSPF